MAKQLMYWKGVYENGDTVSEKGDEFEDIEKDRLKYFLLEGENTVFKHNVKTGKMSINNDSVFILLNDKLLGKSNDVINFKEKVDVYSKPTEPGDLKSNLVSYYTGWKEKNEEFNYIEILFWVDMINQQLKLRSKLTPRVDTGDLSLIINGEISNFELEFDDTNQRQEFVFSL